jgi:hypothetical protein
LRGGIEHRLQAGTTTPVDLQAGHSGAEASVERSHPTDRR